MSTKQGAINTDETDTRKPQEFFSINGTYLIAPDVRSIDLVNDVACILEASRAGIQAVIDGISDQGSQMAANPKDAVALLFGVLYQIEMIGNLVQAIPSREMQS